jgi:hypothetical protein
MKDDFAGDHVIDLRQAAVPAPELAKRIARLGAIELRFGGKRIAQGLMAKVDDEFEPLRAADLAAFQLSSRNIVVWTVKHLNPC